MDITPAFRAAEAPVLLAALGHLKPAADRNGPCRIGYTVPVLPGTISRKRGIVLHINEAYEHEPILPYQPEDACPISSCNKTASQCVEVTAPVTLTPTAVVGSISVACQGAPDVDCVTNDNGSSCTLTITQKVCVSVPIRFGVTMDSDDPTITCADGKCLRCGD